MATNRLEVKYIVFDKLPISFDLWWQALVTLIAIWLSFVHWNWQNLVNLSKNTLDWLYKTARKRQIFNQYTYKTCLQIQKVTHFPFNSKSRRVNVTIQQGVSIEPKSFQKLFNHAIHPLSSNYAQNRSLYLTFQLSEVAPTQLSKRTSSSSSTQNKNVQMIEFIRNRISFNR